MIKRSSRNWIPFWGDKWLFGSMRIEFDVAERGIWWDLMAIAMKDEGFIRANEDTPYPIQQLAGMLIVSEELLKKTIEKFIKRGKITRLKNGTLKITNWKKYCFTDRHMRRLGMEAEDDEMSEETDTMTESEDSEGEVADTRIDKNRTEMNRKEKIRIKDKVEEDFEKNLWKPWPKEGRFKKNICLAKYRALIKAGKKEEFHKTTRGYAAYLQMKEERDNFKQRVMHLSTWMNNWQGEKEHYMNFKYEPPL